MTQLNIVELAKQGNTNAINTLLMQWLNLPNITAKTNLKQDYFQVMWEDILPELQAANLSPASIDGIASHIKSPPSLESLLDKINSDFAIPLLAQCQKIANLDGIITPEETKVLQMINQKLLNVESMEVMQLAIN